MSLHSASLSPHCLHMVPHCPHIVPSLPLSVPTLSPYCPLTFMTVPSLSPISYDMFLTFASLSPHCPITDFIMYPHCLHNVPSSLSPHVPSLSPHYFLTFLSLTPHVLSLSPHCPVTIQTLFRHFPPMISTLSPIVIIAFTITTHCPFTLPLSVLCLLTVS